MGVACMTSSKVGLVLHMARRLLSSVSALTVAAALGACGGKIDDERTSETPRVVTPPPPAPVTPGPTAPVPAPSQLPPPPLPVDAGVPENKLVSGSPQCSPHLPANGTSCRSVSFYVPKCEYDVSTADGGTCRWHCLCQESAPESMSYLWTCSSPDCS